MVFIDITADDLERLKPLQRAYKHEIGEDIPTDADLARLCSALEAGRIRFFGCEADDGLVGCCSVSETWSTFNYGPVGIFEDFYIRPEYRHRGIAGKLVAYAAAHSGVGSLTVGCADCDVDMYKALGFTLPLGNMLAFGMEQQYDNDAKETE